MFNCDVVFSQTITWQQTNGPEGASVSSVVIGSRDQIFVGTDMGGVFRSTDDGEHWTHVGLAGLGVKAVAINAQDHLFVGGYESGVWRSTDDGQSWTLGNQGLPAPPSVGALAIGPQGHLFAGTGIYSEAPGSGIFRSTDNGDSWTFISPELADMTIASLAVRDDGVLFAGTVGNGLYRSTDDGDTWTQSGLTGLDVHGLAIEPDGDLFAATWCDVYRSTDGAQSWASVHPLCGQSSVVLDAAGELFVPFDRWVFRSADDGVTWRTSAIDLPEANISEIAFDSHGHYFCAGSGVYRSVDDGETWTENRAGLIATGVSSIIFDSAGCMLANGFGVSRSCDNGETWTYLRFRRRCVQSLAANAKGHVFAGVSEGCGPPDEGFEAGLLRSKDMGSTWSWVSGVLNNVGIVSLAINSKGHIFAGSDQGRIFRSTDDGESWLEVNTEAITTHVLALAANSNDHMFAVALQEVISGVGGPNDGIFRSTDDGETWAKLNIGSTGGIHALAIDHSNGRIFVAVDTGILRSVDDGDTWQVYANEPPRLNLVVTMVADHGDLFAGLAPGGVSWFKEDGTEINASLTDRIVSGVAIGPSGFLFAGTGANGVFRSVERISPPAARRRRTVRH